MKERHLLGNVNHEMKKTSSSKLDLEESKNAAIAKNTGKNQAKSTSGGWKSRRSSISRLPCSLCRPKCIQYVYVCVYENVSVSLAAPVYVVGVGGYVYIYIYTWYLGVWNKNRQRLQPKMLLLQYFFWLLGPGRGNHAHLIAVTLAKFFAWM